MYTMETPPKEPSTETGINLKVTLLACVAYGILWHGCKKDFDDAVPPDGVPRLTGDPLPH
jgi:hypothetical protein